MQRRLAWRLLIAAGIAGGLPLLIAAPAPAELTGPCTATGVVDGVTYDPTTMDEAEDLPAEGDVVWTAAVSSPNAPDERAVSGEVVVEFPAGLSVKVGDWGDSSSKYENNDTYHYDLPDVLKGVPIPVSGFHEENGVRCDGSITATIGDGGFSNPLAIPALIVTALSAWVLIIAVKAGT